MFQDYNLLESLNAQQNAELTAKFSGRKCSPAKLHQTFESLGIGGLESAYRHSFRADSSNASRWREHCLPTPLHLRRRAHRCVDDDTADVVMDHLVRVPSTVVMVTHSHAAAAKADRIYKLEEHHVRMA